MRGLVTLSFDDGYQNVFDNVLPLLDKYEVPGVFAIPLNQEEVTHQNNLPTLPYSQWQDRLANTHHELAAHGVTHQDLTKLNQVDLATELDVPNVTTLVYPGGGYNEKVIKQASQKYTAARTVQKGMEQIPSCEPMRLHTYNWTSSNWSPPKANLLATWAFITNKWLIETFHSVSSQKEEYEYNVPLPGFKKHLSYLTTLPIRKQTIHEAISGHHN